MTEYERCSLMLEALFPYQQNLQQRWWDSANKAFEGNTPRMMLELNPQTVVQYLSKQFSGEYL